MKEFFDLVDGLEIPGEVFLWLFICLVAWVSPVVREKWVKGKGDLR